MFVHYGLILKAQSATMRQAVIAHQAAQFSNGHIARRMGNLRSARTAAGLGTALAVIAAADRSSAHYMTSTGLDPQGLVDLHRTFAGQQALNVGRQNPYMLSHPLTRDRIRVAESYVTAQPAAQAGRHLLVRPRAGQTFRLYAGAGMVAASGSRRTPCGCAPDARGHRLYRNNDLNRP